MSDIRRVERDNHGASLEITRNSGTNDCRLSISDGVSGVRVVELSLDAATLLRALQHEVMIGIDVSWTHLECVGKVRELKEEVIVIPEGKRHLRHLSIAWKTMCKELVKPFEVDGWKANSPFADIGNMHRSTNDARNAYNVTFLRFVERSTKL